MKIQITISDQMGKDLRELQNDLGLGRIEDLTIHSLNVLRYLMNAIRHGHSTLSPEEVHWISQPALKTPSKESFQETHACSHKEIDTRILEEIHRLLDDNHIDQALKVTHILKILRSHGIEGQDTHQVKSEMLLTAAETFAVECDPEHAAQLICDATKETTVETTDDSKETR
jgi:hypothetical protein